MNNSSFLSTIHIIRGKFAVRLANAAPIPRETSVTGKAQHRSVLSDPKRDKKDKSLFTTQSK